MTMLGTDTRPAPHHLAPEANDQAPAAIVTDHRGLVGALSGRLDELGLDASPERIGRHWTELFPSFRRLPTRPGSDEDDFVVIIESTRTAFHINRVPLVGTDGDGGALLLLRPVEPEPQHTTTDAYQLDTLSELAASVAHEINNPLTTISGWMQIFLAEANTDDPIHGQLASIHEELDRIARIVDKLLAFAQKPSSETELLDISELIRNVGSFLEFPMKNANVSIETALSPKVGVVEGNRSELKQVFLNLMLNARQAMPAGGCLQVSTCVSGDATSVEIHFRDTGHGVPAEAVDHIFDPYYTTRADEGGSGIGLAVSREIVRKMRGDLVLESTCESGSSFLVRLPLSASC